ncbi:MAG TPA: hypothetical protein VK106_04750, partial [Balneolaceae bacterium]|nr:hypothetical protein [Balneolaceae bacterium]
MQLIKLIISIIAVSSLLVSCELLGDGKEGKKVKGGEVVWRDGNSEIFTTSTQPAIDGDVVYVIQN